MFDTLIRNGVLVDGSGAAAVEGDVALQEGRIAAVGGRLGRGRTEVDARGKVVCPGFIDVHTHYDAQYVWDPYATSSIWHGVTTTVIGNCGFAIAPCRPQHRETILRTLTQVEGMSLKAMQSGIHWGFETFPEYLAQLEASRPALNVAVLLGHSALRTWVLGEEAQQRPATEAEVAQMQVLVRQAMAAGAIGLGSSTAEAHNGDGGLPVPSRLAAASEVEALLQAMGESRRGVFEITVGNGTSMEQIAQWQRASGRPLIWAALLHRDDRPEYTWERLQACEELLGQGHEVRPQVSCRPLTMDFTLENPYPFEGLPCWQQVFAAGQARAQVYASPAFRNALRDDLAHKRFSVFRGRWDLMQVLNTENPTLQPWQGRTLVDIAAAQGKDEVDALFDLALADNLHTEFIAELMNTDEAAVERLITHPQTVITLSDAGAHLSLMCDAGYSSTLLGKWVRQRQAMSLEHAIHRLTHAPATQYRIGGRGLLKAGYQADVLLFDPDTIAARPNEWVQDLPAGQGRFISRASGVEHSWVNGVHTLCDGAVVQQEAAARGGQLLRKFAA